MTLYRVTCTNSWARAPLSSLEDSTTEQTPGHRHKNKLYAEGLTGIPPNPNHLAAKRHTQKVNHKGEPRAPNLWV